MPQFRFLIVFALLGCVTAWSCKTSTVQPAVEKKDPVEGLVFLTFVMKNDSVSAKSIQLIGKTIVNQKLKSDPQNSTAANRIWISQLNGAGKKMSSVAIDHPLFRRVEIANEAGQLQSKELKLNDAEFFARVTLFTQTEYIQLEEELSGKITYTAKFKLRD